MGIRDNLLLAYAHGLICLDMVPDTPIAMFTPEEDRGLSTRTHLDSYDRQILTQIVLDPTLSNQEIGEKLSPPLDRINVWRRRTKGPLAIVIAQLEAEALSSAKDLVIAGARGAIKQLMKMAEGDCDCSRMIRDQADNHREVCITPVPYSVRMQAAKALIEILQNRNQTIPEQEVEEVWEAAVNSVGAVIIAKGKTIDVQALPASPKEPNE
jgi:hypothetical protein